MKTWIGLSGLCAVTLASGIALAQTAPAGPSITRTEAVAKASERFARMDANKDGKISVEDRAARKQMRGDRMFAMLDADKNGQISRAEFDAGHAMRGERGMGRKGHHGGGRFGMRGARGGVDQNGDGLVTKAEFDARVLARFDRVDADRNGSVTPEERKAARDAWKATRPVS